jgi:eukaryotic-like serine/threonine-protein kinase
MKTGRSSRAFRAFCDAHRPPRPDPAYGSDPSARLSDDCAEMMTRVKSMDRSLSSGGFRLEQPARIARNSAILQPGRRLGPFRLLARLGQGGQGEVWKTRRLEGPAELVALKVLNPGLAHNPARMAQFRREAQRGPRLTGPSLLAAHELSEIEGFHCMTMPFVECTALRDIIKWRLSSISGDETEQLHTFVNMDEPEYRRAMVRALAEASRALFRVHEQRIAHRDVKPANLLLVNRRPGEVFLCDFGLGRDLDVATSEQMRDGAGTPIYMAPERLLMFTADEIKCDIYSMGVTLFEALTLEKPFRVPGHVTAPGLAPFLAAAEPRVERLHAGDFPEELGAVIMKAMARDPVRRYESARDLALSLDQFIAGRKSACRPYPVAYPPRSFVPRPYVLSRHTPAVRAVEHGANQGFPVGAMAAGTD